MLLGVVRKRVTKSAIVFVNPRVGVASSRLRALLLIHPPGRSLLGSALLGQRHAASLPRISGPLQEERPNRDVGARRHTIGPGRSPNNATGGSARSRCRRFHARASISLTVLACQMPFCFVGMSFWLRLPAISRSDSPPALYCRIIRIAACSAPLFTSWWLR